MPSGALRRSTFRRTLAVAATAGASASAPDGAHSSALRARCGVVLRAHDAAPGPHAKLGSAHRSPRSPAASLHWLGIGIVLVRGKGTLYPCDCGELVQYHWYTVLVSYCWYGILDITTYDRRVAHATRTGDVGITSSHDSDGGRICTGDVPLPIPGAGGKFFSGSRLEVIGRALTPPLQGALPLSLLASDPAEHASRVWCQIAAIVRCAPAV